MRSLLRPGYVSIAVAVAVFVFTVAVWLPNIRLISIVVSADSASLTEKIHFLLTLYGSIETNFTLVSALYTVAIAVLFGFNSVLFLYYIKKVRTGSQNVGRVGLASIGGVLSGMLGIGCAACGTFVLTSVLALFGGVGVLASLPFGGEEFGFIGVGLLLFSGYALVKKINDPLQCKVTPH